MPLERFSVLKFSGQTPVLASCLRCQLKFLTPTKMMADPYAASEYLRKKYEEHHCTARAGPKDYTDLVTEAQTTRT